MTGTPIQNNLIELWSLFDFIYPGRLGSLPVFQSEFAVPIQMGGYANAGPLTIQTSYRCACVLRDLIAPYLLRRWKKDVAATALPQKEEHVVLCKITPFQRKIYLHFLQSNHVRAILQGAANVLYGIDVLRKICNHPCLLRQSVVWQDWMESESEKKSAVEVSGKLLVLQELLAAWSKEGGHKALIFCQTKQMLDLLEAWLRSQSYQYLRMDGDLEISRRQDKIHRFNTDPGIFLFLLTTRVGGVGINLTGADRIIIYDPDWASLDTPQCLLCHGPLNERK